MRVNVIKRKAASNKELSHVVYEVQESRCLRELLYEIMVIELCSEPEVSSPGKIAYETYRKEAYRVGQAWDILKQDFEDGLFRVFFNQKEYTRLEDELDVQGENELVIVKLVMMAGRLW